MGICSSVSSYSENRRVDISTWDKDFPPLTLAQLNKKRNEFWETRVGKEEKWQALRMYASETNEETRAAILESAGLTSLEYEKADTCFCYDETGYKFELPLYLFHEPRNLIKETLESSFCESSIHSPSTPVPSLNTLAPSNGLSSAFSNSTAVLVAVSSASTLSESPSTSDSFISFKLRLSNNTDIKVKFKTSQSILDVKHLINEKYKIPVDSIRIFFLGKCYSNCVPLSSTKITNGVVVNAMIASIAK